MNLVNSPAARSDGLRTNRSSDRWAGRLVVTLVCLMGVSIAAGSPASAHGGDESKEGYILVQQALGYLADDSGQAGMDLAMEKVDDALAAKYQEGVDVAQVGQAKRALQAEDPLQARALLQRSITAALSMQAPATGEQTGTTLVTPALPGRYGLSGRDWGFLIVALGFLLAGVWLAYRFRPHDSVGELRRRLGPAHRTDVERDL